MSYQLKYKKLKYEVKYLNLEKNETEELFRKCIRNFEKAFKDKVGPDYTEPKKVNIEEPINNEEIKNKITKSKVKKVYRKICSKTHPDKLIKLPNSTIKKKLIKQYKEAVNKYKDNDMVGLFDIADELDIKLPEIDESYIVKMESQVKSLRDNIQRYKTSNAWIWYHATGEKADEILNQIIINQFININK
jgi:hypothetical protein